MLTLYTTTLSANGRKPLVLARLLNLEVEIVDVDVYRGEGQRDEYLAINPTGKIPTLVDDGLALFESNAILLHLDDRYGARSLCGENASQHSQMLRWLFWEASQWQPGLIAVLAPFVGHALSHRAIQDPFETAPAVDWQDDNLSLLLRTLEDHLQTSPFLAGPSLTLADIAVAAMPTYFSRAEFPYRDFPAIDRWRASIEQLDAWRETENSLWK